MYGCKQSLIQLKLLYFMYLNAYIYNLKSNFPKITELYKNIINT